MSAFSPTPEDSYREGTLLRRIIDAGSSSTNTELSAECVELHNAKRIDLLSMVESAEFAAVAGHDFFVAQNFCRHTLPHLNGVTADRMMRCIRLLVDKGAGDMMVNRPNEAFLDWLKVDLSRAREVVASALNGDEPALDHLTFALQATGDLTVMRGLLNDREPRVRISALTAISRTAHQTEDELGATVKSLKSVGVLSADDAGKAHLLAATIFPFVNAKVAPTDEACCLAEDALAECGAGTVHVASQVLHAAGEWCSPKLAEMLLKGMRRVDPASKGTIDLIDVALCALLRNDCIAQATRYVEDVVGREERSLTIEDFNSFAREWIEKHRNAAGETIALWLASGKRKLCVAVSDLLSEGGLRGTPLTIDICKLGLSPTRQYFMCSKAIGYLFMQPVTAASILVSTLRTADAELANAVIELLFDPLLVCFGGGTLEYLEGLPEVDKAHGHVTEVISRAREYLAGLNAAGVVKELHPSEYQRQLERIRDANLSREIRKKAHERSIFHDIVHKSVLLHGNSSVTFVEGVNGERRPMHMKMHSYSTTAEWPRMETVDPVGLDIVLRKFRAGQLKS